jgi:hypothetical protein
MDGKDRWAGLGSLRDWALAEARERPGEFRKATLFGEPRFQALATAAQRVEYGRG